MSWNTDKNEDLKRIIIDRNNKTLDIISHLNLALTKLRADDLQSYSECAGMIDYSINRLSRIIINEKV